MASAPSWLATMRSLIGTKEVPGAGNNPDILRWAAEIAHAFPEMATYCRQFTNDAIPWCGLTVGYVMAVNGIRPAFGKDATDRFLWANAWASWGRKLAKPIPGAVMVFTRNGGGHVSLYVGEDESYYHVCGGNQSDQVNIARYAKNKLTCAVWPSGVPMPSEVPIATPKTEPKKTEPEGEAPPVIDPKEKAPTIPAEPPKPMSESRIGQGAIAGFFAMITAALSTVVDALNKLPGKIEDALVALMLKPHVVIIILAAVLFGAIWFWRRDNKIKNGV